MNPQQQNGNDRGRTRHRDGTTGWGTAGQVALFVFLALVMVQVVRLGASGLLVQLGQFEIDRWEAKSRTPDKEELKRSAQFFADSLAYVSTNPWALEGAGALDLAKMRGARVPREALAAVKSAYARFRQALIQRPTSPFLWANLALTKLYLNEIDAELLTALRRADELGPWEPTVQQTGLFVGLAVWRELDPGLRDAMLRTVERGVSRNPQKVFEVVKSYRRFDLVCAIRGYEAIAGPDCKTAAAAAATGNALKQDARP